MNDDRRYNSTLAGKGAYLPETKKVLQQIDAGKSPEQVREAVVEEDLLDQRTRDGLVEIATDAAPPEDDFTIGLVRRSAHVVARWLRCRLRKISSGRTALNEQRSNTLCATHMIQRRP